MSLLVVGSVALDSVETPSGKRDEILGGSAVYFSTAASFTGENLRLVAVIGEDFPKAHVAELEGRGNLLRRASAGSRTNLSMGWSL